MQSQTGSFWKNTLPGELVRSQPLFPQAVRYGLVVRIAGSHPAGPGSIPGNGIFLSFHSSSRVSCIGATNEDTEHQSLCRHIQTAVSASKLLGCGKKNFDEDGIRTHAGRAHWISLNHSATSSHHILYHLLEFFFANNKTLPTPGVEPGPAG